MTQKGSLVVVSGFAGAGKGTVLSLMMKAHDNYAYSVSATTRKPREGEIDGVHYFFVREDVFRQMIEAGELLEHASYVGNYYGTPRSYVKKMLDDGKDVILEIDLTGAMNIRKNEPEAILVFIMPPSAAVLEQRLRGRATETEEQIRKRLSRAADEAMSIKDYDYILVNDDAAECAERLHQLIRSQKLKAERNMDFIMKMQNELQIFKDCGK